MTARQRRRPAKLRRAVTYLSTLEWEYVQHAMRANSTNVSQTIANIIDDARLQERAWQEELLREGEEEVHGA